MYLIIVCFPEWIWLEIKMADLSELFTPWWSDEVPFLSSSREESSHHHLHWSLFQCWCLSSGWWWAVTGWYNKGAWHQHWELIGLDESSSLLSRASGSKWHHTTKRAELLLLCDWKNCRKSCWGNQYTLMWHHVVEWLTADWMSRLNVSPKYRFRDLEKLYWSD